MRHILSLLSLTVTVMAASAATGVAQDADYIHNTDFVFVGTRTYNQVVTANYIDRASIEPAGDGIVKATEFNVYNRPDNTPTSAKYGLTWVAFYCRDGYIRKFSSVSYTAEYKFSAHYSLKTDPVQMTPDAADKPAFDYVCMSDKDRAAAGNWSSKSTGIDPITDADSRYANSLPQ